MWFSIIIIAQESTGSSPSKIKSAAAASSRMAANAYSQQFRKQSSQQKQKLVAHSTAMESIQAQTDPIDEQEHLPWV